MQKDQITLINAPNIEHSSTVEESMMMGSAEDITLVKMAK